MVVSDIDDTIKISHVLSSEKFLTALNLTSHFTGMSALYQAIDQSAPGVEFAYVSNAPVQFMTITHQSFLDFNHFPKGRLYLRENLMVENHKVATITRLIQTSKPSKIIMIGDNGEQDASVYHEIAARFPEIPSFTFIHQVYSTSSPSERGHPLFADQTGFVTAGDLAVQLQKAGSLAATYVPKFVQYFISLLQKKSLLQVSSETAFPEWMNCHDFNEKIETQNLPQLISLQKTIESHCNWK